MEYHLVVKSENVLESDKLGFKSQLEPFLGCCPHISYSAVQVAHKMEIITHALRHHFANQR